MRALLEKVRCRKTLGLIGRYLRAGVVLPDGTSEATPLGVPQGGPLSPLLANIALDPLDKELEARGHKFSSTYKEVLALSVWVRRRVRLYYWKQWKQLRTRRRNLLALGADPGTVHMATRSRKGYWRMSQNEIVRYALNNRWLEEQGVPDVRAIWIVLHYGHACPPKPWRRRDARV
jgi:retron-type reverse transcriptase